MSRPLRIQYPGALYHVISRGQERGAIVRDESDRERRLDWLRRTVETYGWRLHAFVQMTNHEHLFVQTPEPNLADGMQFLNGSYTGYFNRRHRRSGHLFEGRYRGHLVEELGYYLEVSRYIHLNPVRAGLVERPEMWLWSSYPGYQRVRYALPWVTYSAVLGEFAQEEATARRAYARFVASAVGQELASPFAEAVEGLLVGSGEFVDRIQRMLQERPSDRAMPQLEHLRHRPPLDRIAAAAADHFGCDSAAWQPGTRCNDASRAVAVYLARRRFGYPASEVATAFGYRSLGSVRTALKRVEDAGGSLPDTIDLLCAKLLND